MRILRILLGAALLFPLIGCGEERGKNIPVSPDLQQNVSGSNSPGAAILTDQVVVSRSLDFGRVNPASYGTFTVLEQVEAFAKAVLTAERIQGILDVRQPDFDVMIGQGGQRREIHLWLDAQAQSGMYMDVSDTHTGYKLTAESTSELYRLIWGLRYEPQQAEANGDIVNVHGELRNADIWSQFLANVKSGIRDEVQVVRYTKEGEPIFDHLSFDGETIRHKYDNTHDSLGKPAKLFDACKSIEEKKSEGGTEYHLTSCGEGNSRKGMFYLKVDNQ